MAVHLSVTTRDMRRLLELGDPARLQDGSDPFPMSILTDLANWWPAMTSATRHMTPTGKRN
jgi:hypothetical protein